MLNVLQITGSGRDEVVLQRQRGYHGSMSQLLISCVMTAALLVCPLHCFACQAPQPSASVQCRCCHDVNMQQDANSSLPLPQDDCGCSGCICDGATLAPEAEICDSGFFGIHAHTDLSGVDYQTARSAIQRHSDATAPLKANGRDALLKHQTWLI